MRVLSTHGILDKYFAALTTKSKEILLNFFNNPNLVCITLPKPFTENGFWKAITLSHGKTGPFYLLTQLQCIEREPNYYVPVYKDFWKKNYFGKKYYAPSIKKEIENVKQMSSMQQQTIRY